MLKSIIPALLCLMLMPGLKAQTIKTAQAFGEIDQADLELKQCDFEKEAGALVLFNTCRVSFNSAGQLVMEIHRRVKIFNHTGEEEAKVRIEYDGDGHGAINHLQAETINSGPEDKPEFIRLDKKQMYTQRVDKTEKAVIFTFPNVRPGSVIEYQYSYTVDTHTIPTWYFQEDIPVRYSEIETELPFNYVYTTLVNTDKPYSNYSKKKYASNTVTQETTGMSDLHTLPDEPYMSSRRDNMQCIRFHLIASPYSFSTLSNWNAISNYAAGDEDLGLQLKNKLKGENEILAKAKLLKADDEKIAYLFRTVRDAMKWNDTDGWYTDEGTETAWQKKTGNATEINLILCRLLTRAGVKAYPMLVSTRGHGKVNPAYLDIRQFDRAVTCIPADSTYKYLLDASDKYNTWNEVPEELLNNLGLPVSEGKEVYKPVYIVNNNPIRQNLLINAEITPAGKVSGTAQISYSDYNRLNALKAYQKAGQSKYIAYLQGGNHQLSIINLKMENAETDTLPLMQNMDFKLDLAGADGDYIYFASDFFSMFGKNPFLSDSRYTNIDFGYKRANSINGIFKLPAGYKIDAIPKNISLTMPDNSITFKRIVMQQDNNLIVRYIINYNQSIYLKENYAEIHEFHKKMQELLNEQVVLKKG